MGVPASVYVAHVVDPAVVLECSVGELVFEGVLGGELEKSEEVVPEVGGSPGLEGQDEGPVIQFTDVQDGAASEEGIAADAKRSLREVSLECGSESGEGLEFAILLDLFIGGQGGCL